MKVTFISDLHGELPELVGGDLLIVAGDLTARDLEWEYDNFYEWAKLVDYEKVIVVAGNHDMCLEKRKWKFPIQDEIIYLENSSYEYQGYKIHGAPQTLWFSNVNKNCTAFMCKNEYEINRYWNQIPKHTNILITHCPPYGILDYVDESYKGSLQLRNRVLNSLLMNDLNVHCFGHIHEWGGELRDLTMTKFINCAYMSREYKPVNNIITLTLDHGKKSGDSI